MIALLKKMYNSKAAIWLVFLTAFLISASLKNWEKQERIIEHDVHSYYSYLPTTFIYNDIHHKKRSYQREKNVYLFWTHPNEDGKKVEKMTLGLSIIYAPFFFVAHGIAMVTSYAPSGFSEPYKIFLI